MIKKLVLLIFKIIGIYKQLWKFIEFIFKISFTCTGFFWTFESEAEGKLELTVSELRSFTSQASGGGNVISSKSFSRSLINSSSKYSKSTSIGEQNFFYDVLTNYYYLSVIIFNWNKIYKKWVNN